MTSTSVTSSALVESFLSFVLQSQKFNRMKQNSTMTSKMMHHMRGAGGGNICEHVAESVGAQSGHVSSEGPLCCKRADC